ncbi:S9 family peptidase [Streptomyces fuscichromogenes]|uniref:Peptidase YuxL n=1 Tax=Streptomyces fuscichromogenes TaxID=1324013 RepID=A0A917XGQ3_9ACTN|nr:S9 family peptidase [Streptomyces fuscichromogenes]GGN22783.1 putative peptidase YuxL [Streptomyces fuscichromogenes]
MNPSQVAALFQIRQPTLSPDGSRVAFVVQSVDEAHNRYRSRVWVAPTDGSEPAVPFSPAGSDASQPAWSPDGTRLATMSMTVDNGTVRAEIGISSPDGSGESRQLDIVGDGPHGLCWSPDGNHIAYTARASDPRYGVPENARPPLRVTRLFSRIDGLGPVADRPLHVFTVAVDASEPARDLTPGEFSLHSHEWTPDSGALVVNGATHARWDLDLRTDIFELSTGTGELRTISATDGSFQNPSVSPDGTRVAFLGADDIEDSPRNTHVGLIPIQGGERRWISRGLDRNFAPYPDIQSPRWLDDATILVTAEDRGDVALYRVDADGSSAPVRLAGDGGCVTGYDSAAGVIVYALSTPTSPSELFAVQADGRVERLTDLGAAFIADTSPRQGEHFVVRSTDGTVDIDAWILTPPDFDPHKSYPMLLNVHGGSFSQYANRFFDEFHVQAAAGYVVVWSNPRGSSGREEAFGRAIRGHALGGTGWGSVDYADLMAVTDTVIERFPFVDPDRMGILGGSFGGFLTSWTIGHTDRFAAACSERAVNNLLTMESTSDIAGVLRHHVGTSHLKDPEAYLAMSPITYAQNITTPLLILHAESDLRCPIEQAEQLFVALRTLEREVEFVRFSGEGHEMSRSGSPLHRRQRLEIVLEFFGRHLTPA